MRRSLLVVLVLLVSCAPPARPRVHRVLRARCAYGYNVARHRCYYHSDEYWTFGANTNLITVPARNW